MEHSSTQRTIIAAKIAAELFHAQKIARSLSISSKNLRALAIRIGQEAASLAVLASFYDELCGHTISVANRVRDITVRSAMRSVKNWRMDLFELELKKASDKMSADALPEKVAERLKQGPKRLQEEKREDAKLEKELKALLDDMKKDISSIAVVAINSKIEAPNTKEYRAILMSMADDVESMVQKLLKHIKHAQNLLAA